MTQNSDTLWTLFHPSEVTADDRVYSFDYGENANELVTKINVALALGRPLLLTGLPGVGKSSVAEGVARAKGWQLFKVTVTSRMDADELKADFDDLRRLSDAQDQSKDAGNLTEYMRPGVLWQAYNPPSALEIFDASKGGPKPPEELKEYCSAAKKSRGRVLLIDEIDKGDIDFANDLLDAFDRGTFKVSRTGASVYQLGRENGGPGDNRLLVVITSNSVRTQSEAFYRRCLPHKMERPKDLDVAVRLGKVIAKRTNAPLKGLDDERLKDLAELSRTEEGGVNIAFFTDLIEFAARFDALPKPKDHDGWLAVVDALRDFARTRLKYGEERAK